MHKPEIFMDRIPPLLSLFLHWAACSRASLPTRPPICNAATSACLSDVMALPSLLSFPLTYLLVSLILYLSMWLPTLGSCSCSFACLLAPPPPWKHPLCYLSEQRQHSFFWGGGRIQFSPFFLLSHFSANLVVPQACKRTLLIWTWLHSLDLFIRMGATFSIR